jgi:hypothetical protein
MKDPKIDKEASSNTSEHWDRSSTNKTEEEEEEVKVENKKSLSWNRLSFILKKCNTPKCNL